MEFEASEAETKFNVLFGYIGTFVNNILSEASTKIIELTKANELLRAELSEQKGVNK